MSSPITRLRVIVARLGVALLCRSGVFNSFFGVWRWAVFRQAERRGLHILPVHYYSPVPDTSSVAHDDSTPKFIGVDASSLDASLRNLTALIVPHQSRMAEIAGREEGSSSQFAFEGAPYGPIEADTLYAWIRTHRPRRIIEIGCGHTTLLMSEAIGDAHADESGYACDYRCIEPNLPAYLSPKPENVTDIIEKPLQAVPLEVFDALEAGDLLFIDSSHVVAYGSDVLTEYLVILPRLKPGVVIHIHDIFLPYDYPNNWIAESVFLWSEQYLLAALLQAKDRYRVIFPIHQLYRERGELLRRLMNYEIQDAPAPCAMWLEITQG